MGGRIVGRNRMTPKEYQEKTDKLMYKLAPIAGAMKISIPLHYRHKADFGDIDIIAVNNHKLYTELRNLLISLGVTEFFESNGTDDLNFSIAFDGAQVDFLFFPESTIEFARCYLSYNSLGMVIGLTARNNGFKLSGNGLILPVLHPNHPTNVIDHVTVSTDFNETLSFLGFDPERYHAGFDTMNDMHEFIARSPYFSRDFFSMGSLNSNQRRNLRNNAMYVSIKDFLKSRSELSRKLPSKEQSLTRAFKHFPLLKGSYDKAIESALRIKKEDFTRHDMKLLFESVYVPYELRKEFLAKMLPLVNSSPNFHDLSNAEKRQWFKEKSANLVI